jgi:3-oxoacyl-[acyl-carrier protein] reductase
MDLGLDGKVAVVTGSASGIGRTCTELLLREGCKVVGTDIQEAGLRELEAAVDEGAPLSTLVADAALPDGALAPIEAAVEEHGRLDILIAAAGVTGSGRGGLFPGDEGATQLTTDEWDLTMAINLRAPIFAAQAAIREMSKSGWGRIVVIASLAGQIGSVRAGPDYAASKAGLVGAIRSLASTAGVAGITLNAINPGAIETPMLDSHLTPEILETLAAGAAVRRLGSAEELAAVAVMMVSTQASFITGAHIDVNGGFYYG